MICVAFSFLYSFHLFSSSFSLHSLNKVGHFPLFIFSIFSSSSLHVSFSVLLFFEWRISQCLN